MNLTHFYSKSICIIKLVTLFTILILFHGSQINYYSSDFSENTSSLEINNSILKNYSLNGNFSNFVFSTYFGGNKSDEGNSIAVDMNGNTFITGTTTSTDLPTLHALSSSYNGGGNDAFVAKFNITGGLVFSTYLGGSGSDFGTSISVDISGNCYITGYTSSNNFPIENSFQSYLGGGTDAFVVKLNATGSLDFSSYLGGNSSDFGNGIAVDKYGNSYITGKTSSNNFPTKNAYQSSLGGSANSFITKFNTTGGLMFSTFFGGNSSDTGNKIFVDELGNFYVTGSTLSTDFPIKNSYYPSNTGSSDVYLSKFNSTNNLIFSTYLGGGSSDIGTDIAVDTNGNILVVGTTHSSNFPLKNPFNSTFGSYNDGFIVKFTPEGTLSFSSLLGIPGVSDYAITVDANGNCFITSEVFSSGFISKNDFNIKFGSGVVTLICVVSSNDSLIFNSFIGGSDSDQGYDIAVDSSDNIYLTGLTISDNFPVINAYESNYSGSFPPDYTNSGDCFIVKISFLSILRFLSSTTSLTSYSTTTTSLNSFSSTFYTSSKSGYNLLGYLTNFPTILLILGIIISILLFSVVEYRRYKKEKTNHEGTQYSFRQFLKDQLNISFEQEKPDK